ncbi:MAG: ribose 1,5-bisphosphate isomerase [Methanomassiliicoccales archaeon]|nr:ribose 1,5-bisphosphate isomerase [Methanomassiliicoccales archaeon]MDD1756722.1 ribose 1,5-bisphosphate isomerase [Methanomassiliicoccales archaeon]
MSLEETAASIRSMEVRGAGEIARRAAEALRQEALDYNGHDPKELWARMQKGRDALLASRPTAVSLWNGVQAVFKGASPEMGAEALRKTLASNADIFIKRSKEAVEVIGRVGAKRIRDGDRVLTHCNSKAALSVIIQAHKEGKSIDVFATESRPWRQGLQTLRDLASAGIKPTLIVDSAARWLMKDVDVVVVGADTICSNGALINKIGTSQIALAAHEARVPFLVAAETFKFSPKTMYGELVEIEERDSSEVARPDEVPAGAKVLNPVFDATPPEYIDAIITEVGVVPPSAAYEIIVKELGHEFIFERN